MSLRENESGNGTQVEVFKSFKQLHLFIPLCARNMTKSGREEWREVRRKGEEGGQDEEEEKRKTG